MSETHKLIVSKYGQNMSKIWAKYRVFSINKISLASFKFIFSFLPSLCREGESQDVVFMPQFCNYLKNINFNS